MLHTFVTHGERPVLMACLHGKGRFPFLMCQMILDTGADTTCFPSFFDKVLGHDNQHPKVTASATFGVGGKSAIYMHTIGLSLLDPNIFHCRDYQAGNLALTQEPPSIWKSGLNYFGFVKRFKGTYGLLERDVMREWNSWKLTRKNESLWEIAIDIPESAAGQKLGSGSKVGSVRLLAAKKKTKA